MTTQTGLDIAIIGMACRFPGASTIDRFWQNLSAGVESIHFFTDAELEAAGIPSEIRNSAESIKAGGILPDIDQFDAGLFGLTPREASITDPQHRLFLECAWEALEHAGYDPARYPGSIGVFGGAGMNSYQHNLGSTQFTASSADYQRTIGNENGFLATRVAYKLNLRGPAVTVQTACSTSLVTTHLACQSLLSGESDMVLAGGVSVRVPQITVYQHQEGSVLAPDGHCRAFAADAQGMVIASGAGIVVLKRLEDALVDGDTIYAVIKGSAINNDGSDKVGYMAPGIDGQTQVIHMAHQVADIHPETVGYIEAHGTGTALGDPIEIAALTRAFRMGTQRTQFCAIGSVKSNIGHTDAAAGVAGLIKTALALYHGYIPPSLHAETPNPEIDFANSPFFINTRLRSWESSGVPRRAGVSAFGLGGTNAHLVLEEAPPVAPSRSVRSWHVLPLSARTTGALDAATAQLAQHLQQQPAALADVAYTLQVGRATLAQRRVVIGETAAALVTALETSDPTRVFTGTAQTESPGVVFLFPGGGSQYVCMGQNLYRNEPVFRETIDQGAALLHSQLGLDIREVIYPATNATDFAAQQLQQISCALPALFLTEYALARLWMSWGVQPVAMIGHSLGEYTAACLAGVMTFADALTLVVQRGKLFQQLPPGAMLSVPLAETELRPLLDVQLSIAAINLPDQCVVSGTVASIDRFAEMLQQRGIACRRLAIDVAAHSVMIDPILEPFAQVVRTIPLHPPRLPFLSNMTGTWITAAEATDPHYWTRHLRQTVYFHSSVQTLLQQDNGIFLEVGPGRTLSSYVRRHPHKTNRHVILQSLPHPDTASADLETMAQALGKLWLAGGTIDWVAVYGEEPRRRIPLPTYPFERQRYWIDAPTAPTGQSGATWTPPLLDPPSAFPTSDSAPEVHTTAVAPQTPTEQLLLQIWQQVLGYTQIGRQDNFFDLGGDSLLVLHLLTQIRAATGVQLTPQRVLQAPTIAALAAAIADASPGTGKIAAQPVAAVSPLVIPLKPEGILPALFLVHPVGGGVFGYRELVRSLRTDHAVYGIQAQGFDDDAEPISSLPEMARRYLTLIEQVQPTGPYLLAGHSFGGAVAFELAQQLQARHQSVALLALLDTPDLTSASTLPTDDATILATMLGAYLDNVPALVELLRQMPPDQQLAYTLEQARRSDTPLGSLDLVAFQRLFQLVQVHLRALRTYHPQPYIGELIYLRAAIRDAFNPPHPEQGWLPWVPEGITIAEVPGTHTTMLLPPQVETVAKKLRNYLVRARH